MIGFDGIGFHAVAEFISATTEPVVYGPFSRPTGNVSSLWFKKRADYTPPGTIDWDDDSVIEWDDSSSITWDA